MRRRPLALIVFLALIPPAFVGGSAMAGDSTGPALVATPDKPAAGATFTLSGDINGGADQGARTVQLKRHLVIGEAKVTTLTSKDTNPDGTYEFEASTSEDAQYHVVAPAAGANDQVVTKDVTVEPIPAERPAATVTPDSPDAGQNFTITGDINGAADQGARVVQLKRFVELDGTKVQTIDSNNTDADGKYTFTTKTSDDAKYHIVAPAKAGAYGQVVGEDFTVEPNKTDVTIEIVRNDADTSKATINGTIDPPAAREVTLLQKIVGSDYKRGETKLSAADGTVSFDVTGLNKRFTKYQFKLEVAGVDGGAKAFSPYTVFTPGPDADQLGDHVMRFTTKDKELPVTKGDNVGGVVSIDGADELKLDEFQVRGNSTSKFPKKPFKVKFDDGENIFKMGKDKTWNLLANYNDHALIRDKVGRQLGEELRAETTGDKTRWSPQSVYTEVFINDRYQGSYDMTESIKLSKQRMNFNQPDENEDDYKKSGMIIEINHNVDPAEPGGAPAFKGPISDWGYSYKDPDTFDTLDDDDEVDPGGPDPEGLTDEKVSAFKTRVTAFEKALYGNNVEEVLDKYLDEESAIDYFLVKEFTKDQDSDFFASIFFSWADYDNPNAKFYMGPQWDFDRSAGSKTPRAAAPAGYSSGWYLLGNGNETHETNSHSYYKYLVKDPDFVKAIEKRWDEVQGIFKQVGETGGTADDLVEQLGMNVAYSDRGTWTTEGDRYPPRASTYAGEISFVKNWYNDRYDWMNGELE